MKLLRELTEDVETEIIAEGTGDDKKVYIKGPFMQANVGNKNKRMYPLPVMEEKAYNYINDFVNKNRAYGELGHPDKPTINLDRASHRIIELKQEGNTFYGKALVSDSPMGKIVKTLISEGGVLGVSSRGVGSLKLNPRTQLNEVQNDFRICTAGDVVADPSAPDCFVDGIMEEAEWIFESGVWKLVDLESAQKVIKKTSSADLLSTKIAIFEEFVNNIKAH